MLGRIECVLIPVLAKAHTRFVVGVVLELIPRVPIAIVVMEVVVALKDPMMGDDPMILVVHVRAQHSGGELSVIVRREIVADVVQESAHDLLLVGAVAQRESRGLQAVGQAIDLIAECIAAEIDEHRQDRVRESRVPALLTARDELVLLARTIGHVNKVDRVHAYAF